MRRLYEPKNRGKKTLVTTMWKEFRKQFSHKFDKFRGALSLQRIRKTSFLRRQNWKSTENKSLNAIRTKNKCEPVDSNGFYEYEQQILSTHQASKERRKNRNKVKGKHQISEHLNCEQNEQCFFFYKFICFNGASSCVLFLGGNLLFFDFRCVMWSWAYINIWRWTHVTQSMNPLKKLFGFVCSMHTSRREWIFRLNIILRNKYTFWMQHGMSER